MREPVTFFFGRRRATRFEFGREDAHHLCRVLRQKPGDVVWGIDGAGTAFEVLLEEVGPRKSLGAIIGEHPAHNEPPHDLVLLQGLIQQGKMDWLVEKATELGVTRIAPIQRSEGVGRGRMIRWHRLSRSAAKQCRRGLVPAIQEPRPLKEVLGDLPGQGTRLLADPEGSMGLPDALPAGPVVVAVGPERGFSGAMKELFGEAGFVKVSLGRRRLRAETAAIVLLSQVLTRQEETAVAGDPPGAAPGLEDIP